MEKITQKDLTDARESWGADLLDISNIYDKRGIEAAKKAAKSFLKEYYDYDHGPVLFKPTLASGEDAFRLDREGALSYFVGHNKKYLYDEGFALKPWVSFTSETKGYFAEGDVVMWMGRVTLKDAQERETTVEKSWGYRKDSITGKLRIILHHSSLPYTRKPPCR